LATGWANVIVPIVPIDLKVEIRESVDFAMRLYFGLLRLQANPA
jgi:hypothetical protein